MKFTKNRLLSLLLVLAMLFALVAETTMYM